MHTERAKKKNLKNWRPITLLNVTYKIASLCIGNRIRKVLPTIISYDQSGFMSDRFVGDNIRLMYDILVRGLLVDNLPPPRDFMRQVFSVKVSHDAFR